MRVRFTGDGDPNNAVCVVFGLSFPVGQWVAVPAPVFKKLDGNPTFDADLDDDGEPEMSVDEMRAALDARGVKYHHKAGAAKLKALLDGDG